MPGATILVVADTSEASDRLLKLLPANGYQAIKADDFTAPPTCDVVLTDVTQLRSASPFAGLKAQRRMGCQAPAILFVPRVTEQMAVEIFPLGVRDLVLKPIEDDARLARLGEFVARVLAERDQSAVQVSLAKTQADLARRLEEMTTLSKIGRAIAVLADTDAMLARIVEAGIYLTRADEGAVYLIDPTSGELMLRAEQGMGTARAAALRQPSRDSDAAAVLQTGKPVMRGGDTAYKLKTGYLAKALICVPIVLDQKVIGVLGVYSLGAERVFEASDLAVLSNLADYSAIALDKANILARAQRDLEDGLKAARDVLNHAATLLDPVDGIEAQVDTLLSGDFDPLTEKQRSAVSRVKQATGRLKEVVGLIRAALPAGGRSSPV